MRFTMIHENYNVSNLDVSIAFYEKALGLREILSDPDGYWLEILPERRKSAR